jgi:hypothetical protein
MILVVASAVDDAAVKFAEEIAPTTVASVVTCKSLALESSALRFPDHLSSTITAGGRSIAMKDVRCILNLLPAVFPEELFFYSEEEREYQAAEFHALLTFLLTAVTCPVINRPTSMSLSGPFPNPLAWYHLAHRLSIPVVAVGFSSDESVNPFARRHPAALVEASYLNGKTIAVEPVAEGYTRTIAECTGIQYLRTTFVRCSSELQLASVSTVPNLRDKTTRNALIEYISAIGVTK